MLPSSGMGILRVAGGLAGILLMLAVLLVAIYGIGWIVLIAIRNVPIIGRRHRHETWDELQRHGGASLPKSSAKGQDHA